MGRLRAPGREHNLYLRHATDDTVYVLRVDHTHEALIDRANGKFFREYRWYVREYRGQQHLRSSYGFAHHLVIGHQPPGFVIRHLNGDRLDCRTVNLAFVPRGEVLLHTADTEHFRRRSATGVRGVTYDRQNECYRAHLQIDGVRKSARFATLEEASQWRENTLAEYRRTTAHTPPPPTWLVNEMVIVMNQ